jgi:hypothetical protein
MLRPKSESSCGPAAALKGPVVTSGWRGRAGNWTPRCGDLEQLQ